MPATSRATVVLPVPGLPTKTRCRVIVGHLEPGRLALGLDLQHRDLAVDLALDRRPGRPGRRARRAAPRASWAVPRAPSAPRAPRACPPRPAARPGSAGRSGRRSRLAADRAVVAGASAQAADHLGQRVADGVELLGHRPTGLGRDAQHLVVGERLPGRARQRGEVAGRRTPAPARDVRRPAGPPRRSRRCPSPAGVGRAEHRGRRCRPRSAPSRRPAPPGAGRGRGPRPTASGPTR